MSSDRELEMPPDRPKLKELLLSRKEDTTASSSLLFNLPKHETRHLSFQKTPKTLNILKTRE